MFYLYSIITHNLFSTYYFAWDFSREEFIIYKKKIASTFFFELFFN